MGAPAIAKNTCDNLCVMRYWSTFNQFLVTSCQFGSCLTSQRFSDRFARKVSALKILVKKTACRSSCRHVIFNERSLPIEKSCIFQRGSSSGCVQFAESGREALLLLARVKEMSLKKSMARLFSVEILSFKLIKF